MILRKSELKHLVLGMGEIGSAIKTIILGNEMRDMAVVGIDKEKTLPDYLHIESEKGFDVLHICFPYTTAEEFEKACKDYAEKYLATGGLVVIHSTVPVGTTRRLGSAYVHSPCRGVHPNLLPGLMTFVKYFGGHRSREAAEVFRRFGLTVATSALPENTEAMKLWETEQYRRFIETMREIHTYCEQNGLDFDLVYTAANQSYNEGYEKLGMEYVRRPVLYYTPGPTGGHCVEPNHKLLFPEEK